ncbi:hypothetical protein FHY55_16355 [Oceanicola sp. D3]|nr:hypothetical protein FHY55_16355 [Oceanicola sp. D3]
MFDQDEDDALSPTEYDAFDETRAADMEANAEAHGGGNGPAQGPGRGKGKGVGQGKGMGQGQGQAMGNGYGNGQGGGGVLGEYVRSMDRTVADANRDGVVTRAEFEGISADWFAQRDRDGDGFITVADFGPRV